LSPTELLAELRSKGVELTADGDTLRCRAPRGLVTPDLAAVIRERKPELLRLLRVPPDVWLHVPQPDPETVREVLHAEPGAADREALHHELACALWDLRDWCVGRQPWGGAILVRGRPLADWLSLDDVAAIIRGHSGGVR
jgi:hypothetical protein